MPKFNVSGPHPDQPYAYVVGGSVSKAGWSLAYRVIQNAGWYSRYSHPWTITNGRGRVVKPDGRLGKAIIAAVEAHKAKCVRDPKFPWLTDDMLRESDARIRTAAINTPGDHPIYKSLVEIIALIAAARETLKEEL